MEGAYEPRNLERRSRKEVKYQKAVSLGRREQRKRRGGVGGEGGEKKKMKEEKEGRGQEGAGERSQGFWIT